MKKKINSWDLHICPTNTKVKSLNGLKFKVACPLKFMVTHIGRIASTLVIAVNIITIQEKENLSLMKKFQENLRNKTTNFQW